MRACVVDTHKSCCGFNSATVVTVPFGILECAIRYSSRFILLES